MLSLLYKPSQDIDSQDFDANIGCCKSWNIPSCHSTVHCMYRKNSCTRTPASRCVVSKATFAVYLRRLVFFVSLISFEFSAKTITLTFGLNFGEHYTAAACLKTENRAECLEVEIWYLSGDDLKKYFTQNALLTLKSSIFAAWIF